MHRAELIELQTIYYSSLFRRNSFGCPFFSWLMTSIIILSRQISLYGMKRVWCQQEWLRKNLKFWGYFFFFFFEDKHYTFLYCCNWSVTWMTASLFCHSGIFFLEFAILAFHLGHLEQRLFQNVTPANSYVADLFLKLWCYRCGTEITT